MQIGAGLLYVVLSDTLDSQMRLIYADWLEEQGDRTSGWWRKPSPPSFFLYFLDETRGDGSWHYGDCIDICVGNGYGDGVSNGYGFGASNGHGDGLCQERGIGDGRTFGYGQACGNGLGDGGSPIRMVIIKPL